jgi:hypothetical protein
MKVIERLYIIYCTLAHFQQGKTYFCFYCIVDIWMIFSDSVHGPVLLSDPSHPREAPQGRQERDGVKKPLKEIS